MFVYLKAHLLLVRGFVFTVGKIFDLYFTVSEHDCTHSMHTLQRYSSAAQSQSVCVLSMSAGN
jgi:hypothetical protein